MNLTKIAIGDFETDGIKARPEYPPKPVGLALDVPGMKPRYYAWGHPEKNNATMAEAVRHVKMLIQDGWVFC